MSFKNGPRKSYGRCSLRIGDETHTARKAARLTTMRKAGTLSLGDVVRCTFCDFIRSEFGGLYRVTDIQPAEHEGNYRNYVLEKISYGGAK
ncbi:MAG: hypothetical protein IJS32_02560 [Kiritimatiellae bacterium]|nr:hypothetical protein [Kiritimatiellia bacterium]